MQQKIDKYLSIRYLYDLRTVDAYFFICTMLSVARVSQPVLLNSFVCSWQNRLCFEHAEVCLCWMGRRPTITHVQGIVLDTVNLKLPVS